MILYVNISVVEYQVTVHTTPAGQDLLDNKDGDKEDENKNQKDQKVSVCVLSFPQKCFYVCFSRTAFLPVI